MSGRPQWLAVIAGLALLGAPVAERGLADALAPPPSEPGLSRGAIMSRLTASNPRLNDTTSGRIADAILRCDRERSVPPEVVLAVLLQESSARPWARSPKGAIGLMQVMPYMFRELELRGGIAHLETNVEAGCLLLAENIQRLGLEDGISTYYWGNEIRGDAYLRGVQSILSDLAFEREPEGARGRG